MRFLALVVAIFGLNGPLFAEVVASTPTGFALRRDITVASTPTKVFSAMSEIGRWWSPKHTYSGDVRNLSLELAVGGCFCERLANNGSVRHLEVAYVEPGRVLRMSGGLGPLQAHGVAGSLTLVLRETSPGVTGVLMTYSVGGFMADGIDKMAGPVDFVLGEQLTRLKALVETGDPSPVKPPQAPD